MIQLKEKIMRCWGPNIVAIKDMGMDLSTSWWAREVSNKRSFDPRVIWNLLVGLIDIFNSCKRWFLACNGSCLFGFLVCRKPFDNLGTPWGSKLGLERTWIAFGVNPWSAWLCLVVKHDVFFHLSWSTTLRAVTMQLWLNLISTMLQQPNLQIKWWKSVLLYLAANFTAEREG